MSSKRVFFCSGIHTPYKDKYAYNIKIVVYWRDDKDYLLLKMKEIMFIHILF